MSNFEQVEMHTNLVRIHAENCPQISVRIHLQFSLALDAEKLSKDSRGNLSSNFSKDSCPILTSFKCPQIQQELQQTFCELPIKQFCLIGVGYVDISDLFQGPKIEIKSISVTQIMLQNSVRIQATKFSKDLCYKFQ